jgi:hypothetical protein
MAAQLIPITPDVELPLILYQGQPVLTFAMIDKAHGRKDEHAGRTFRQNRKHFIEDDDYYRIDFSHSGEFLRNGITIPPRGLIAVTETGYLMLVKSFTDDLAWQVQRTLVKTYFRAKRETVALGNTAPPLQGRILLTFSQGAPVAVRLLAEDEVLISRNEVMALKQQLLDDNLRCVASIQEFCKRVSATA